MAVTEKRISSNNISQTYTPQDDILIKSAVVDRSYGLDNDYIEAHIYTATDNILYSDYNLTSFYTSNNSQTSANSTVKELYLDPTQDILNKGYSTGDLKIVYSFLRKYFSSDIDKKFFIKEISSDRTELRLSSNDISNEEIINGFSAFVNELNSLSYYKEFRLNFGDNKLIIGINVALDINTSPNTILIKLYEPLPAEFDLRSTCWIVENIGDPVAFEVTFSPEATTTQNPYLRGPNFNVGSVDRQNSSTDNMSYEDLFVTPISSSYQAVSSILNEKGVEVNVDYTDYSNFIHFSSAKERLLNFYYKLSLIESYKSGILPTGSIGGITGPTSASFAISSSQALIQSYIDNIIKKFDGFEYYLYFESNSFAFPKQTSTKPYQLYSVTSSAATLWLSNQSYSASLYDEQNQNNLINTIPSYLKEDTQNAPYELFLNMIGQHFDNVWIYEKAVTDLYNANSNVYKGVSKDLVAQALRSLGIKLYTNNTSQYDVFQYLLGANPSGGFLYPTSSFETLVTASIGSTFYSTPADEINKEIYKRLYHNVPYLLKSKGTERGLRALISCFGIPDTILRINEFGGSDKESGSFEQYYDRFSYALDLGVNYPNNAFLVPWAPSYYKYLTVLDQDMTPVASMVPDAIEFRFKPHPVGIYPTQTLFQISTGSNTQLALITDYNSATSTGSYIDYANLDFVMYDYDTGNYTSCSVYLPLYNGDWWNVLVYRETGSLSYSTSNASITNTYKLIVKNSIYDGPDGNTIGFQASSSIVSSDVNYSWMNYSTSSFIGFLGGHPDGVGPISSGPFSGSIQEYRNWIYNANTYSSSNPSSVALKESAFNFHVMNPESIEGNTITSSYTDLIFRLPLGNDLKFPIGTNAPLLFSTHPALNLRYSGSTGVTSSNAFRSTGSFFMTSSFNINTYYSSLGGASSYGSSVYNVDPLNNQKVISFGLPILLNYSSSFKPQTEIYYSDSPNTGISKRINDKIRITSYTIVTGSISGSSLTTGSVLSPFTRIEEPPIVPLTQDLHILEVALSPQDEISDDIIAQLGYFNLGTYIGDPRYLISGSLNYYPDFNKLRDYYFSKYTHNYNLNDYVRLIKFFDNSLFKMIQDFTPAKSDLSSGIVIKPSLLERCRYPQPKINTQTTIAFVGSPTSNTLNIQY